MPPSSNALKACTAGGSAGLSCCIGSVLEDAADEEAEADDEGRAAEELRAADEGRDGGGWRALLPAASLGAAADDFFGSHMVTNSSYWISPSPLASNSAMIAEISSSVSAAPPPGRDSTARSSSTDRLPLPSLSKTLKACRVVMRADSPPGVFAFVFAKPYARGIGAASSQAERAGSRTTPKGQTGCGL